uniref:DUF485 domain-containing protein n=1 Tax=Bradyrhizobium sp. DOA9 TaxID=1126627 RepID=UPI0030EB3157
MIWIMGLGRPPVQAGTAPREKGLPSWQEFQRNIPGIIDVSNLAKIERDPNYQELVRRRSSLGWLLSAIMLVIYFGFILLVAYAPKFLGIPLGSGVTTVGIPVGLSVIVLAFVLTGIYVRRANSSYDVLIRKIVEENRS